MMDHPNIARVLDGGSTPDGRPFFVMELVKGVPITQHCDDNKLSTPQRLELFVQVCHAVQHAHQKGIIHRDLKPTNVLVTLFDGKPIPKVIDFGIAKALNHELTEKTLFTEFRQFMGTPEYMSPEQAGLSGLDVDTRSDVYSLGVLLYELLTGTTPFELRHLKQAAYAEIERIIKEVEPPRPSTKLSTMGDQKLDTVAARRQTEPKRLSRTVRGELDWIVMRCLEKDRTRRYDTANGLALDVQRHLAGEPVSAGPPSSLYQLRKLAHRHRVALTVSAVVLLSILGGAVATALEMTRARIAERVAVSQRQEAERQRIIALESGARANTAAATLLLQHHKDAKAAEPLFRDALTSYEILRGPEHEDVAAALVNLADDLKVIGDLPQAEQMLRRSLAIYQHGGAGGAAGARVGATLQKLAQVATARADFEGARRLLHDARLQYDRIGAEGVRGEVAVDIDLSAMLEQQGDAAGAESALNDAAELCRGVPESESWTQPDVGYLWFRLASMRPAGDGRPAGDAWRRYAAIAVTRIEHRLRAGPFNRDLLAAKAELLVNSGRFAESAADHVRLAQTNPDDHLAWFRGACIHLYLHQDQVYRDECRQMVDRFGDTTDVHVRDRTAKSCLLAPDAIDRVRFDRAVEMARRNVAPDAPTDAASMYHLAAGLAEYRSGRFAQALDWLQRSRAEIAAESGYDNLPDTRETIELYLAMTQWQLGRRDDARSTLNEAVRVIDRDLPNAGAQLGSTYFENWFICHIARREAESLIKAPAAAQAASR